MVLKSRKHRIDGLIAPVLFGVFAACILSVLLTGADAYRRLTERDREAFGERTCLQYVATKVRQAKSGEEISVSDFGGTDALCISEKIGEREFVTRVYCYDGWLREIFASSSMDCKPEDGERILRAEELNMSLEDGLLRIELTDSEGNAGSLVLSLRGEGENV